MKDGTFIFYLKRLLVSVFYVFFLLLYPTFIIESFSDDLDAANDLKLVTVRKLFYKGELNSAIERFEMMLIVNPADAESRTNLACSYALLGDYEKALIEFEESFKLANDSFKAIILIDEAMVYLKRKMYGPAVDALNKAVEIRPGLDKVDDFSGFHSICIGLANGSVVPEKINLSLYEDSPFLFDTASFIANPMSKVNLNVYVFSDLEPLPLFFYESGRAHLLSGRACFFEENYDEAENEFKQAIFSAKNIEVLDGLTEAAANFFLGWVELKRNNFPETLSFFKKATELKPYNFGYVREFALGYLLNHNYILASNYSGQKSGTGSRFTV